jgi:hypothetical protein
MVDKSGYNFSDYLEMLTDCVDHLSLMRERTGRYSTALRKLCDDLKHEDPFVSYRASKAAIRLMRDKSIYH